MYIYYIDDSFFQPSAFSRTMLARLERCFEADPPSVILISAAERHNIRMNRFIQKYRQNINVLISPCLFDVCGIRGHLRSTLLLLDDYGFHRCFSGSYVLYDCVRKSDERRYLDLFVHDGEKHSQ